MYVDSCIRSMMEPNLYAYIFWCQPTGCQTTQEDFYVSPLLETAGRHEVGCYFERTVTPPPPPGGCQCAVCYCIEPVSSVDDAVKLLVLRRAVDFVLAIDFARLCQTFSSCALQLKYSKHLCPATRTQTSHASPSPRTARSVGYRSPIATTPHLVVVVSIPRC
jgi:hypothetical protein